MGYSKNDFAGFKSRAPANWLARRNYSWRPFLLLSQVLPQADLPKMAAFLRLRLKVYGIAIAICPSGKLPSEEKKSWI